MPYPRQHHRDKCVRSGCWVRCEENSSTSGCFVSPESLPQSCSEHSEQGGGSYLGSLTGIHPPHPLYFQHNPTDGFRVPIISQAPKAEILQKDCTSRGHSLNPFPSRCFWYVHLSLAMTHSEKDILYRSSDIYVKDFYETMCTFMWGLLIFLFYFILSLKLRIWRNWNLYISPVRM